MENTEINLRTFPISQNFRIEQCQKDFSKEVIESHKKLRKTLMIELSIEEAGWLQEMLDHITCIFSALGIYLLINTKKYIAKKGKTRMILTITAVAGGIYFVPPTLSLIGRVLATFATKHTIEYSGPQAADYVLKGFWKEGFKNIWNIFAIVSAWGIVTYFTYREIRNIHVVPFKLHKPKKYQTMCELFDYKAFKEIQQMKYPDEIKRRLHGESFAGNKNRILHAELKANEDEANRLADDPEIGEDTEYFDRMNYEYIVFPMIQDIGLAFYELKRAGAAEKDETRKEFLETKADELHEQFKDRVDLVRYEKVILMDHYNKHQERKYIPTIFTRIKDPRKIEAFLYDWNFHNEGYKKLQEKNICPQFRHTIIKYKTQIIEKDPLAKKYVRIIEKDEDGNEIVILDNPPQENMEPIDFRLDDPKNWANKKED